LKKLCSIIFIAVAILFGIAGTSGAALVNGDFSAGSSSWDYTVGETTFVNGTAVLGMPGTGFTSILSQAFDPEGASAMSIAFDYQWQINAPIKEDTFSFFVEQNNTVWLLNEGSGSATFNVTQSLSFLVTVDPSSLFTVGFRLDEVNASNGTRVVIDNVSAAPVPVPAAVWLLGSGLLGLIGFRRKRNA